MTKLCTNIFNAHGLKNLLSKKNSIEKYSFLICFPLMASAVVYKCQETLLLLDGKLKAVARPD